MTLLLKQIFAFIKLLNSDQGTNQIAAGIGMGFILGMTPVFSLQTVLVFVAIFLFRVQAGAAFLSAFFFAFVAYLLDPLFHTIGLMVLQQPSLRGLFTALFNMPIVPLTKFNNTIVMGAGIVALASFPLVFFLSRFLVMKYRSVIVEKFKNSKLWGVMKATSLFKWYSKYEQHFG